MEMALQIAIVNIIINKLTWAFDEDVVNGEKSYFELTKNINDAADEILKVVNYERNN